MYTRRARSRANSSVVPGAAGQCCRATVTGVTRRARAALAIRCAGWCYGLLLVHSTRCQWLASSHECAAAPRLVVCAFWARITALTLCTTLLGLERVGGACHARTWVRACSTNALVARVAAAQLMSGRRSRHKSMACAIGSRQTFSVGNAAKRRGKLRLRRTGIAETAKPSLHRRQRIEPAAVNGNRKMHNERSRRRGLA